MQTGCSGVGLSSEKLKIKVGKGKQQSPMSIKALPPKIWGNQLLNFFNMDNPLSWKRFAPKLSHHPSAQHSLVLNPQIAPPHSLHQQKIRQWFCEKFSCMICISATDGYLTTSWQINSNKLNPSTRRISFAVQPTTKGRLSLGSSFLSHAVFFWR